MEFNIEDEFKALFYECLVCVHDNIHMSIKPIPLDTVYSPRSLLSRGQVETIQTRGMRIEGGNASNSTLHSFN